MTTVIIHTPTPVRCTYDDTKFYDIFCQCEDPYTEIERNKSEIIQNALHYIDLNWEPVNEMPPLTADDISLICAHDIMMSIIRKFGL